jgi:bis(5'-nucleosyl)-tetraphosphatase (symmetrical)
VDLKMKGKPGEQPADFLPWFDVPERQSRGVRVVCGHWSTLGFKRRPDLLALDTGCVWGGSLTAVNLDVPKVDECEPIQLACDGHQEPGGD